MIPAFVLLGAASAASFCSANANAYTAVTIAGPTTISHQGKNYVATGPTTLTLKNKATSTPVVPSAVADESSSSEVIQTPVASDAAAKVTPPGSDPLDKAAQNATSSAVDVASGAQDPTSPTNVAAGSTKDSKDSVSPAIAAAGSIKDSASPSNGTASSTKDSEDSASPASAASGSVKGSASPVSVSAGSVKDSASPVSVAAGSTKDSASPASVAAGSTKDSAFPANVAAGQIKGFASYSNGTVSSTKDSASPASVAAGSIKGSASPSNVTAGSASKALAPPKGAEGATVTNEVTKYTTIPCESPTTVTYQGQTYTVTEATTLTIEDCECTSNPTKAAVGATSTGQTTMSTASAPSKGAEGTTVTNQVTKYTTIPCESPTTVEYQGQTYTVTESTTLTIEDCGCTSAPSQGLVSAVPTNANEVTTTAHVTKYATIPCESATTVEYQGQTYTVTEATTLTIEDCGCTSAPSQALVTATNGPAEATATAEVTKYTTIPCESPTTIEYQGNTYTVTEPTTLTIEDCSCTSAPARTAPVAPAASGSAPAASAPAASAPAASAPAASGSPKATTSPAGSPKATSAEKSSASNGGKVNSAAPTVQATGNSTVSAPALANAGCIAQVANAVGVAAAIALLV